MKLTKNQRRLQEAVIKILRRSPRPLLTVEIYAQLEKPPELGYFKKTLTRLKREGVIERLPGRTWSVDGKHGSFREQQRPPKATVGVQLTGRIILNRSQGVFFFPDDGSERIYIRKGDLKGAVPGDRVRIRLITGGRVKGPSREGKVLEILERQLQHLVGRVEQYGKRFVVIPLGTQLNDTIYVRYSQMDLSSGQHVLVRLHRHPGQARNRVLEADVLRLYAHESRPELLQEMIKCDSLLAPDFPPEVLAQAEALDGTVHPEPGRMDLRELITFTIDPADARDFDDAVSCEPLPDGGFRLGVHIADVTRFVEKDTPLDREALNRGTSVYLPGEVVPMLPHRLSTDLCSLNEGVDKYTMSVLLDYDEHAHVRRVRITPSLIRSRRRFTYEEVQKHLSCMPKVRRRDFDPHERYDDPILESLYYMNLLFRKLHRQRLRRGSLDFSTPEPRFQLDETGMPIAIHLRQQMDSHRLVEEFMLAANRAVAEHLQKSGRPAVYRVHEPPAGDKPQRFTDFMQHLGVRVDREELQRVKGWQRILDSFAGTEKRLVLEEVILRSMMKARYEVSNDGHFGLAFDSYTHFTSPIRRYPDLLVHRILKLLARGESYSLAEVRKAARISSQQELVAQEAEREAVKIKQLLYLEQRVGDVFRGVIRGVERFGLFVELSEVLVDGLIPAQQMDDDFYDYDEKSWTFRGRRTGTVYQLGQVLQVQITRCDVQERLLDLRVMREDEESDSGSGTDLLGENEKSRRRPRSKQSGRRKNGKGKGYNGSPRRRGKKKKP